MMPTVCLEKSAQKSTPQLRWEHVDCNLCGHDDTDIFHRERLPYFDTMLQFDIVRCRHCRLVYTNPRLAEHNAPYLWASSDDPIQIEQHARTKQNVFAQALDEIELYRNHHDGKTSAKLLDVGCGSGHFLAQARDRGFEICGIEPAAVPARYARQVLDVPVIADNVAQVHFEPNSFDVITAWDVIEHVPDPQAVLRRCAQWLRPNGIMALRFPSATWQEIKGLILHRLLSSIRPVFGPTIHLYFFTEYTFDKMAQTVGLQIRRVKTTPAEANTSNMLLDWAKIASHMLLRAAETVSNKHLGNLEVYCRKT